MTSKEQLQNKLIQKYKTIGIPTKTTRQMQSLLQEVKSRPASISRETKVRF